MILAETEKEKLLTQMGIFAKFPVFKNCSFETLKKIYLNSFEISYKNGDKVFQQGDHADCCYIVKSGEFMVNISSKNLKTHFEYFF